MAARQLSYVNVALALVIAAVLLVSAPGDRLVTNYLPGALPRVFGLMVVGIPPLQLLGTLVVSLAGGFRRRVPVWVLWTVGLLSCFSVLLFLYLIMKWAFMSVS